MKRRAVLRGAAALACALAFHAAIVACAVGLGWLSTDAATLPELDLTSVDLSFSDTPDETAAPALPPPSPAVSAPTPPPPPAVETPPPPPILDPAQPPSAVTPPSPPPPRHLDLPPPDIEPPPHVEMPPPQPQQPSVAIPPTPAPSQARVAADRPPSPRRRIKPDYPKGARQRGEEGDVTLELASCGFPELEQAAVQAVQRARFTPARRGSSAVPATARITLTFRLKD